MPDGSGGNHGPAYYYMYAHYPEDILLIMTR